MHSNDDVHGQGPVGPLAVGTGLGLAAATGAGTLGLGWVFSGLIFSTVGAGATVLAAMALSRREEEAEMIRRRSAELAKWDEDLMDEELIAAQIRAEAEHLFGKAQRRPASHS
ncbi:MAG: hypothetical protein AAFR57_11030 [Pseudomonadota bacterium]